ncbi:juvenile hormone acid O-methyltransferase-like [Amblyomma americanum]
MSWGFTSTITKCAIMSRRLLTKLTQKLELRPLAAPVAPSAKPIPETGSSSTGERDPRTFLWLREHNYRDNINAMDSVCFKQPRSANPQYLDVGSGPGNYTREVLLPRLRPYRQVVASDKSLSMMQFAKDNFSDPDVSYELLDIESDDYKRLLDEYGQFDRVYSFMTFHYVHDLDQAYRNVFRLLKDGGEFLAVSFTGAAITDVWHRLHGMEPWHRFMHDPRELLSERFYFTTPIPHKKIAENEERALCTAGLELASCRQYDSVWTLPNVDAWLDCYVPFFRLDSRVPSDMRGAFRDACRSLLQEASTPTPEGRGLRHSVIVVHAQKPLRS